MFLDQFGAAGCPQIWPRGAQIGQKCPKIAISSSGGLKRLEQHGTKVEQVRGGPCRSFWTNLVQQGAPKFDPGAPKMAKIGPKCPKRAISGFRWSKTLGTAWNKSGMGTKTLAGTSLNPFHLGSQLFQPLWTTETLKLPFLAILGQFWPFWALLGQI